VKIEAIFLSAALVAGAAGLVPVGSVAAREISTEATKISTEADAAAQDAQDLGAKLEAARARLEAAAHEVAELTTEMGKPVMDRYMVFGEGPARSIIGVQLDAKSKDGARIQEVSPGGPAADAGLHTGDVIVGINGKEVKGDEPARQVLRLMRDINPESKVTVRVMRDGKPRDFVVTTRRAVGIFSVHGMPPLPPVPPGELPDGPGDVDWESGNAFFAPPILIHGPLGDMELATLTPQLGRYFGTSKGVLVVRAPKAEGFKLEDGDVILSIDGREPSTGSHATRILSSYQPGEKISLQLMRDHKPLKLETTLPASDESQPDHRRVRIIRKAPPPL